MPPSIIELSKYLSHPHRIVPWNRTQQQTDGAIERISGRTCLAVICYVLKFCSNSEQQHDDHLIILIDAIRRLDDLASEVESRSLPRHLRADHDQELERLEMERLISETFFTSFVPNVQRFFKVPKLQEFLSEKDMDSNNIPKRNEMLAGFIHFLLQILNCEDDHIRNEERAVPVHEYVQLILYLRNALTFLLTYLGDIPFQATEPDEGVSDNLIEDFEVLANEAGSFIYSRIFTSSDPNNVDMVYESISSFMQKINILNLKINVLCTNGISTRCAMSDPTAVDSPSIIELSKYLSHPHRIVPWNRTQQQTDGAIERISGRTCLAVICYVLKFCSNSEQQHDDHLIILIDAIRRLDDLASEVESRSLRRHLRADHDQELERLEMERLISETFFTSFVPNVQRFFKVPKLQEFLSEKDMDSNSIPKRNEMLAGFIHFLLQILNCEDDHIRSEERTVPVHEYVQLTLIFGDRLSLRKELTFLLTYLGDIPFQATEPDEGVSDNLIEDFEVLANEAGSFIYSRIFTSSDPNNVDMFYESISSFMQKIDILNSKINVLCTNGISTRCVMSDPTAVDSPFIVDSLLDDLKNVLNGRAHLNDDMKDKIETLHRVLMSTQAFLRDINAQQDTEIEELKECLVRIRDMGYEAEYLINSYMVGNVPVWYMNLRLLNVVHKFELIATGYDELKIIYGARVIRFHEGSTADVPPSHPIGSSTADDIVVGFEDETTKILDQLTGGSEDLQIVSVLGMPGLGKTTFTKKLYNDPLITYYFHERVWCVVSQTYNKRNVLIDLLMSSPSTPNKETLLLMDDENLAITVYQSLWGRRYLVVMDDVWSREVWDDLGKYFPDNKNRSRVMFTSRIRDIVPIDSIIQPLPLLSEDQCWELLQKKVFHQETCSSQLVHVGMQIAAKCNGLPLAVVVMAGILLNKEKDEDVWKEVEQSLELHTSNCRKILELSYKHLPSHLKLCFLYMGAFSEEIRVKRLIRLWISEGFIRNEEEMSPEIVARNHLMELINRSLVLVAKNGSTGGVKACRVHDLLRDMCLRKANEETFLNLIKDNRFSAYEKHHRLCVNSAAPAYLRPFSQRCRSFLGHLSDPSACLPQMKLLRVVELSTKYDMNIHYMLTRINYLVYLRYLVVDPLPNPIVGYLINLEFLRIDGLSHSVNVSSVLLKMPKLKHLHVRIQAKFDDDCDTSQTFNLETFSYVGLYTYKAYEVLRATPHLRKLKCFCIPFLLDFCFLTKLESLNIIVRDIFQMPNNPTWISFPSTVEKLNLYGTCLPWEKMSIIGRLPNLQVLKLRMDAFEGEEWETSEDEFQELRFLKLDKLKLQNWITSSTHFPKLRHLVLRKCEVLQSIPTELGDITTLEMIEVHDCGYETSISGVQIEQEQLENGNEELKVIITNSEWSKEQLVRKYYEEEEES